MVGCFVAPLTISLNRSLAGLMHDNRIRNISNRKHIGVAKAILSLKGIVLENIILWYVAVVACSHFPMGTVKPGSILRPHYMTVNACFRGIRKIAHRIRDI